MARLNHRPGRLAAVVGLFGILAPFSALAADGAGIAAVARQAAPAPRAASPVPAAPVPATPVPAAPVPAPAVARYGYEVVATFPHDPAAFTQGLVWNDGVLVESTGRNPSSVRRVRLDDGAVLTQRDLDQTYFGEGLTVMGDKAYSLTWTDGKGFIWNASDLTPAGTFSYGGEGWGLTHDGTRLILSDGQPALRFFDPTGLTETGSVPVTLNGRPVGRLNELEFIDGEVWANIWQTDFIVRIDPSDGRITGVIDLTGLLPDDRVRDPGDDVLNGIAWDPVGRRLFVTGKNWPSLFEIRLTGPR